MDDDQWKIFPGDPAGKKLGIKDRLPFNLFDGITSVNVSEKGKINLGSTGH